MRRFGVLLTLLSFAPLRAADSPLVGLWGATRSFGPEVRGELTLARGADGWRATVGGVHAKVVVDGDGFSFDLAGKQGSFTGRRDASGQRLRGVWKQAVGAATGVAWATPLDLVRIGRDVYRGKVEPLDEAVTLYVDVRAESDGGLSAVLRNPDGYYRNGRLKLVADGPRVKLVSLQGDRTLLEGTFDEKADRLLLPIADFGATFELTRRTRDDAIGYYPRTPAGSSYWYRAPIAEDDGWTTAALGDVGMDAKPIGELVQKLLDTDPRPQTSPLVQGLLIARHGKLVLEEYFFGFDKERRHDIRSGGKTWASVLVGIAMDRGAKLEPSTPVHSLFPEVPTGGDPRKSRLTLEHLMTMTGGFPCNENDDDAPGNEDKMQSQTAQPDWYRFMLDLPLAKEPGESAAYCSGAVNLIGGMVQRATKRPLVELFDEALARPLGFRTYHLNLTPTGEAYLGGGTHLRPRDWLKLGQLYLDGGVWHGKRLVSKAWVETSTVSHPMKSKGTDGYNWHVNQIKLGERVYRQYEANGNGGQLLMVLPELDLVVLFTAGNFMNYNVWRKFRDELLPTYVIAATKPGDVTSRPPGSSRAKSSRRPR